jgi:hypothetical protein
LLSGQAKSKGKEAKGTIRMNSYKTRAHTRG